MVFAQATGADVLARRAQLEENLAELEAEIEKQQVILQEKQRETVSLERDIAIVDARIQSAALSAAYLKSWSAENSRLRIFCGKLARWTHIQLRKWCLRIKIFLNFSPTLILFPS